MGESFDMAIQSSMAIPVIETRDLMPCPHCQLSDIFENGQQANKDGSDCRNLGQADW